MCGTDIVKLNLQSFQCTNMFNRGMNNNSRYLDTVLLQCRLSVSGKMLFQHYFIDVNSRLLSQLLSHASLMHHYQYLAILCKDLASSPSETHVEGRGGSSFARKNKTHRSEKARTQGLRSSMLYPMSHIRLQFTFTSIKYCLQLNQI